jgi:hypothetical protein
VVVIYAIFKNYGTESYRKEPSETGGTPFTIPHSEVALIVNDVFDPMYGYHEGRQEESS